MKKLSTVLVLICLLSLPLLAQTQGSWEIVRADYGYGNNWTDVTERVQSLVQGDSLSFRVAANTVGVNARRSGPRSLRLQLKDGNGRTRQITYRDNQQVNLRIFSQYQSSSLRIDRATYGSEDRTSDVTARLNSQIQNGQIDEQVTNESMGGDPAPQQSKTLTVQYAINGQTDQVVINEGDTLRLGNNNGGNNGRYDNDGNNGGNNGRYNGGNNGGNNGRYRDRGSLHVNRATYGSEYQTSDVTGRLNSQIQNGQIVEQVTNESMGGDPAPQQSKNLTVQYTMNGQPGQVVVNEGDTLRLGNNDGGNNAGNNGGYDNGGYNGGNNGRYRDRGSLHVNRATYGSGYQTTDVTARLNSQIHNGQIDEQVTDESMGGDPAPQQSKNLTVQYTMNGQPGQVVVNEGDTLRLGNNNGGNNGRYGDRRNGNDGNGPQLSQRVRCESQGGNQRNYCVADTRNGVRLLRTLGNSQCSEGSSWGYNSGSIWVNNGCRADFELQGNGGNRGANTTTTIQNGTELSVRTNEPIDSSTATAGQTFSAVIAADVLDSSGTVRIPRGSDAQLVIRNSSPDGNNSSSDLVLDVNSLTVAGTRYDVSTGDLNQQGRDGVGMNKRTGVMVGGGAAIGTLIGAIVGGGKGAAIGAGIGAGAGVGTEVLTKGHQVRVPAETLLNFRLDQDLLLRAAR